MKRTIFLISLLALVICICGCTPDESTISFKETSKNGQEIDVDLTSLSATMVYAEVYNMMCVPEDYIGKTIKMSGIYFPYFSDETGRYYFSCIVQDATACCTQGIEFELNEDYTYPNDYPVAGDDITVIGQFDTYIENGSKYCTLQNARLN